MKLLERIKPKSKSAIVNYIILLLVVVEIILTLMPSLIFVAEDRTFDTASNKPVTSKVDVTTSLQNYLWFPASGNNKLNDKLTEGLVEEHFQKASVSEPEYASFVNKITLFPVLLTVVSIALLIVCVAFGGNMAATVLAAIWGIVGILACFVNNNLFHLQSTYIVQMVLIFVVTAAAIGNMVLTCIPKAKKESDENKVVA